MALTSSKKYPYLVPKDDLSLVHIIYGQDGEVNKCVETRNALKKITRWKKIL
jgi:hypothetical protein